MEEQLSLLVQLQGLDAKIRALTEEKNRLPEMLASLERRRATSREEIEKAREELQTAQKNRREKDKDLEAGLQKVEKLKARTSEIKTNKEYQALLKEIEAAEQENKAIEDEILILMEKTETTSAVIKTAESRAAQEDTAIRTEQQQYEGKAAETDKELTAMMQSRQKIASRIEPPLLARYQRLLQTRGGTVVVEADMESCMGCHMSIPPQLYVNVKKNDAVLTCPHCGRILYYKEKAA